MKDRPSEPFIPSGKTMLDFFYTYPILSYLFFREENLIHAINYDYPNINFLPQTFPIHLAKYAKSMKTLDKCYFV